LEAEAAEAIGVEAEAVDEIAASTSGSGFVGNFPQLLKVVMVVV